VLWEGALSAQNRFGIWAQPAEASATMPKAAPFSKRQQLLL